MWIKETGLSSAAWRSISRSLLLSISMTDIKFSFLKFLLF